MMIFTSAKLGLLMTATVAAAVPATLVVIGRSELNEADAPPAAVAAAPDATSRTEGSVTKVRTVAIAPSETPDAGTGPADRMAVAAPSTAPVRVPTVSEPPGPVEGRVSALFGTVVPAPVATGAAGPRPLLPPLPGQAAAAMPDLPPDVPREPPVPEAPAGKVAALEVPDETTAVGRIEPIAAPIPKPAPRDARPASVSGSIPAKSAATYRAMIEREAKALDVPAKLALAVVQVESGFDAGKKGEDGKVGLFQITPRIARALGYKGSDRDLADPDVNVRWGVKYLAGARKRAGGDLCRTAMKYLGGHYTETQTAVHTAYCGRVREAMARI